MALKFLLILIILGFWFSGCKRNPAPEVRNLLKDTKIGRLDLDLFRLDTVLPDWGVLQKKYGRYWDTYTIGVLQLGRASDSNFSNLLALFLKDPVMREVADTVAIRYTDISDLEKQFSQAWAYYRYYFPQHTLPEVYTHISGFNQSIIVDSAAIGISLDNYLGKDCIFYSMLAVPVPVYARQKMTREDIVRDALIGWLTVEFVFRPLKNDLISGMIYQGKIMYLLQQILPEEKGYRLLGFTAEQEEWCRNNEEQIWRFLIENDYLFSTQQRIMTKYLNDAPFTSGMPVESPGRAVVWTGYRIVGKYMQKKKNVSLERLMAEQDYHKILREAGYRP